MLISSLQRWSILVLLLTITAVTSKFNLQVVQKNEDVPQASIMQENPSTNFNNGKANLLKDDLSSNFGKAIVVQGRNFNAGSLITDKYIFLVKNDLLGKSLWKIDLETIELERIPFPFPTNSQNSLSASIYTRPKLMDLGNGDVALSYLSTLYIVNNETFEIKQTINGHDQLDAIKQFYTYQDPKTKEKKCFVSRQLPESLVSELIRLPSGEYEIKEKIMFYWDSITDSPRIPNSVYLNGLNSGVYLENCVLKQIKTLDSIVSISYDQKYFLRKRVKVAVSYDDSFFVLRNESGFFEFYAINQDLDVSLKQSVLVSKQFSFINKGATTTDDAYVFVSMTNTKDQSDIVKIETSTGKYSLIAGSQISTRSQLDFNLFEVKHNRLVTLEERSNKLFLHLRTVKDLATVFEFPLVYDFPVLDSKLVGSPEWNLTFAVAIRISASKYLQENDTIIYLFKVEGDKIVNLNITRNGTFDVVTACDKYIVNYKQTMPTINILHFSNLTVASQIQVNRVSQYHFNIEKNIFMLRDFSTFVYDFKKSLEKIGQIYASNNLYYEKYYSIILVKRGLLYQSPTQLKYAQTEPPTKTFFNISYLPFQKQTVIQEATYAQRCEFAEYYLNPTQNCNFIFFINCLEEVEDIYCKGPMIVKYKECSGEREEYPIRGFDDKIIDHIHYISTDRKYIISVLRHFERKEFLVDIRTIDNLDTVYFTEVLPFTEAYFKYLQDYYFDIIKDNLLMIRSPEYLTAYFIDSNEVKE